MSDILANTPLTLPLTALTLFADYIFACFQSESPDFVKCTIQSDSSGLQLVPSGSCVSIHHADETRFLS